MHAVVISASPTTRQLVCVPCLQSTTLPAPTLCQRTSVLQSGDHCTEQLQLAPIRMALPFLSISQPRLHQIQISLRPSCRGGPEDSETPPTCKVWMILSQVMALPKKQFLEIIEDILAFENKMNKTRILRNVYFL